MSRPANYRVVRTLVNVLADVGRCGLLVLRSRANLAAENLFLRKQLALYIERQVKPDRADDATRIALVALSRFVDWRQIAGDCQAGHADPLASKGLSPVLAMEIPSARTPQNPCQSGAVDRGDGHRQSDLG
jgi:hypothetical protein